MNSAEQNVTDNLKNNVYPGRGIIIGINASGNKLVQVYWIMGRSENSRNRIFTLENGTIKTQPFDISKCEDPSLIIYNALCTYKNFQIVTNGDQTDTICEALGSNGSFESALSTRTFEPDGPNFTPRISGIIDFEYDNPIYKLNILKTLSNIAEYPQCHTFEYRNFKNGIGHCIHTYKGDGNPLPSFEGEPYVVPLAETIDEIADYYWDKLDPDNRISVAVKSINKETKVTDFKIINKLA